MKYYFGGKQVSKSTYVSKREDIKRKIRRYKASKKGVTSTKYDGKEVTGEVQKGQARVKKATSVEGEKPTREFRSTQKPYEPEAGSEKIRFIQTGQERGLGISEGFYQKMRAEKDEYREIRELETKELAEARFREEHPVKSRYYAAEEFVGKGVKRVVKMPERSIFGNIETFRKMQESDNIVISKYGQIFEQNLGVKQGVAYSLRERPIITAAAFPISYAAGGVIGYFGATSGAITTGAKLVTGGMAGVWGGTAVKRVVKQDSYLGKGFAVGEMLPSAALSVAGGVSGVKAGGGFRVKTLLKGLDVRGVEPYLGQNLATGKPTMKYQINLGKGGTGKKLFSTLYGKSAMQQASDQFYFGKRVIRGSGYRKTALMRSKKASLAGGFGRGEITPDYGTPSFYGRSTKGLYNFGVKAGVKSGAGVLAGGRGGSGLIWESDFKPVAWVDFGKKSGTSANYREKVGFVSRENIISSSVSESFIDVVPSIRGGARAIGGGESIPVSGGGGRGRGAKPLPEPEIIPEPPPPPPPSLGFKLPKRQDVRKKKKKMGKVRGVKTYERYSPSIEAGLFNIRGKKPKVITGLEVRPITGL